MNSILKSTRVAQNLAKRHFSICRSKATIELPKFQNIAEYLLDGMKSNNPDKPAIIEATSDRRITYGDFPFRLGAAIKGLSSQGVKKGDVVGIHLPNCPEYIIAFQAIASIGATATTSNPLYTPDELAHQFNDSKAKFVITIPLLLPAVTEAMKKAPGVEKIIVLGEASGAFLQPGTEKDRILPDITPVDVMEDILVLPYSSGTTGLPKGVQLTHMNIMANVEQCVHNSHVGINRDDVVMGLLPCYHIYGMTVVMSLPIRQGATVVSLPKFDPALFLESVQKYKCSFMPLVPPIISFLAKHPVVSNFDLSSVKTIFSGAAPLDAETQKAVESRIPTLTVRQGYGMTESSPVTHANSVTGKNVPGSIGTPVASTEVKIVDVDTGAVLGIGADNVGEMCIRGPQVMKGYHNNPEATKKTLVDGWLHTGDIAYRDENDNFFIVDRLKELIKTKGFQVAPAELEYLITSLPAINDAAVIGIPDDKEGEVPIAFVVKQKVALAANPELSAKFPDITEKEVMDHVASKTAVYKHLHAVFFVDAIPRNPSGKILRRVLKERVASGEA